MKQLRDMLTTMDKNDKHMFLQMMAGGLLTILLWWAFKGRHKYSVKGMT